MALRLAFMGTPEFSVPILRALYQTGHEIVAVYSQPPRPSGRRGLGIIASPVEQAARALDLPVFAPATLNDEQEYCRFAALKLDAAIVVAYGLLLPRPILAAPRLGCYNGHASLLPRWRGAAPIQRAIQAGDKETGMMVMKMDEGLDTGSIALAQKITIEEGMTAGKLHDCLSLMGAELMVEAIEQLDKGELVLTPQNLSGATYARKIKAQETRIDWTKPALELERTIRAFSPTPGAWCEMMIGKKRERVKILAAQLAAGEMNDLPAICNGQEKLFLTKLQKSGGKPLSVTQFLRGNQVTAIL